MLTEATKSQAELWGRQDDPAEEEDFMRKLELQDGGGATGTHEMRRRKPPPLQGVGLARLLGTDLGPQMDLILG